MAHRNQISTVDFKHTLYILTSRFLLITALATIDFHDDDQPCICVPYWRCKKDISGLLYNKVLNIDIRVSRENRETSDGPCSGYYDVCCPVECGRKNLDANISEQQLHLNSRILNGNDAEFGEFPWMLAILQERVYKCGASLIHPQVAITAAHCVSKLKTFKVRAGEWNWTHKKEAMLHQDRTTEKVIIHPDYNPHTLANDLALVILDSHFNLTQNVGIICLPPSPYSKTTEKCTVSGWGRTKWQKGTYQSTLKKLDISLVPRDRCLEELRHAALGPQFYLHGSVLCAGDGSKDACKGDGGSPLFCEVEGETGRYEQVGIVSWGLTCGVYEAPGVYVNVGLFVEWIDAEMEKHQFDKNIYRYY